MTDEDLIHAPAEPDLSQSGQQSSVLAAVARAIMLNVQFPDFGEWIIDEVGGREFHSTRAQHENLVKACDEAARAALLALAEAEIPEAVRYAGSCQPAIVRKDELGWDLTDSFRAMLRALAKEEGQ